MKTRISCSNVFSISFDVKHLSLSLLAAAVLFMPLSRPLYGQTLPSANLQQLAFIPMPKWTQASASYDVAYFDWETGVMYFADHANVGVSAIDTKTLTYLGTSSVPGCPGASFCTGMSGVLVAPDLQKLVLTDRDVHIYIFDLRLPGSAPTILTGPPGQDELDYDPINQRAYIGNTVSNFAETVVD